MSKAAEYTLEEVSSHNSREDAWLVIKDKNDGFLPKVYDVTNYLDDHPGGAEIMLEQAGQDATDMFEDIGHTAAARGEMKKFFIGTLLLSDDDKDKLKKANDQNASRDLKNGSGLNPLALMFLLVAIVIGYYFSSRE